jgi:hypothetical protein
MLAPRPIDRAAGTAPCPANCPDTRGTRAHKRALTGGCFGDDKPVGDNARKGAVKKRSQLTTKTMGKKTFTKRNKVAGQFMAQKKTSKFKGVRKER